MNIHKQHFVLGEIPKERSAGKHFFPFGFSTNTQNWQNWHYCQFRNETRRVNHQSRETSTFFAYDSVTFKRTQNMQRMRLRHYFNVCKSVAPHPVPRSCAGDKARTTNGVFTLAYSGTGTGTGTRTGAGKS